uniref:Uncharacterized protein n=1 Tax=Lepeophtheirus salmonis TaxID=72036 RepID=A0A0K2VBC4_LEPSM
MFRKLTIIYLSHFKSTIVMYFIFPFLLFLCSCIIFYVLKYCILHRINSRVFCK